MDDNDLKVIEVLLDEKLKTVSSSIKELKEFLIKVENELKSIIEQTKDLTQFREQIVLRLEEVKEIKKVVKENCYDIAKLTSIK